MGVGWLVDGGNIGTQTAGVPLHYALDTILIDGGIKIQNGRVTHLVGGFMYRGQRWRVWIFKLTGGG
jgi:hypothetical protein